MNSTSTKVTYLKDYQPPSFIIDTVHLYFDLHEENTHVKSILVIQRNIAGPKVADLVLDGEMMDLQGVWIDGKKLTAKQYSVDASSLTIFKVADHFTLEVEVIIQPQNNTELTGLYKSRGNFCTQCEAHGFRRITYFLDRPDVMSRFTTTITADKKLYPLLLSNGNLMERRNLAKGRHWVRWEDPSLKSAYLFALVAGDFDFCADEFVTQSGRKVALSLYVEKGYLDQTEHAMQSIKRAMLWDETHFGREYDLDIFMIVAVSDFTMGAMENKGLNIFNIKYILAKPEVATDEDYIAIENVIGHEYFHNWTGNRITCRDWFQITLKEGLTVFRDQNFIADMTSAGVARINSVDYLRNLQFPEDASPVAHPIRPKSYIEINNFYTHTVYRKGAEVIRMIATLLGKENFRKGMDLYFTRHDEQAVTTEEFLKAMEDASGRNLTQFRIWYDQPGTPLVEVSSHYDEKLGTLALTVKQSCAPTPHFPKKKMLHFPLAFGFLDSKGHAMTIQPLDGEAISENTHILEITQAEETFNFVNLYEEPVLSLLRGFSAPVKLMYPFTDDDLIILWLSDDDPFCRWEAGQILMQRIILKLTMEERQRKPLQLDARVVAVFETVLTNPRLDDYLTAKLLTLPSENYLLQQMEIADVDALHAAILFMKKTLGLALKDQWAANFQRYKVSAYQYQMAEVGARSFRNLCLDYLVSTTEEQHRKIAYQQFLATDNMTDALASLKALNDQDCNEREEALNEYYNRYEHQPLAINKWFNLKALSSLPDTFEVVRELLKHPAFNIKNPNNVYALLDGFTNNITHFHLIDGSGYQFVAEQVLTLNTINPQVAARLVRSLTRWQNLDRIRYLRLQEALKKIAAAPNLSKDVYEIVSKSLVVE